MKFSRLFSIYIRDKIITFWFAFFFVVVVIHETITFERLVVACSARSVSSKGFSELLRRPEKKTHIRMTKKMTGLKEKKYLSDGI